jgi:hypothetical protein
VLILLLLLSLSLSLSLSPSLSLIEPNRNDAEGIAIGAPSTHARVMTETAKQLGVDYDYNLPPFPPPPYNDDHPVGDRPILASVMFPSDYHPWKNWYPYEGTQRIILFFAVFSSPLVLVVILRW